jgi:Na+-transporting NADH:ubiquinone oxidoreductase subunit F
VSEAVLAVALFCGIVLALVSLILAARSQLLPEGAARIQVNERRTVDAVLGQRLLEALAAAGIALPAACGGKGSCGQCRITVLHDAPPARPTESERLSRGELARGIRLACQLRLRSDLEIRIPDEIFGVRSWTCRVRSSRSLGTMIREIVADLPHGEAIEFRAGAFVQVTAPPYQLRYRDLPIEESLRDEWSRLDLWRYEAGTKTPTTRAYSLANHPGEDRIVTLLVRLATPPPRAPDGTPAGIVSVRRSRSQAPTAISSRARASAR